MAEINETRLRVIYSQLTGLNESLLPKSGDKSATVRDGSWNILNEHIKELVAMTGEKDFSHYMVKQTSVTQTPFVLTSEFSTKVYSVVNLIYKLYGDNYDLDAPVSPTGNWISSTSPMLSQSIAQTQTTEVRVEFNQTLQYITEVVVSARTKYAEGTKERTFLEKLKESAGLAKTTTDVIKNIFMLAATYGISADELAKMFNSGA